MATRVVIYHLPLRVLVIIATSTVLSLTTIAAHAEQKGIGFISYVIKPPEARKAGARWRVDGLAWQKSGTSVPVTAGMHSIEFKNTADWSRPASKNVSVSDGQVLNKSVFYSHLLFDTVTLPGNVTLDTAWIPAGTFLMGAPANEQDSIDNEKPQHQVTLTRDFFIGQYEVTKEQWQAVMGTTPWFGKPDVSYSAKSAAVYITQGMALNFCAQLSTLSGKNFTLPTEAQWEYACRAGTTTRCYWGDDPSYSQVGGYCWWDANANSGGQQYAHIVGQKLPNTFLIYDMAGNVDEWCLDNYALYSGGNQTDPVGVGSATSKVHRGGNWTGAGLSMRSAFRNYDRPGFAANRIGFRVLRLSN